MKLRLFVTAAFVASLAASAFAAVSPQYADWGKGPYQFLLTKEEAAAWKKIDNDDAAKAFVDLFWARRDPTPNTPANEYRNEIEGRIAAADKSFGEGRVKGSMTDRGKALILYGQPKRMERSGTSESPEIGNNNDANDAVAEIPSITWVYEDATTKEIFGVNRAGLRFSDRFNNREYKFDRSGFDLNAAQQRAIARSITQPNLTSAPSMAAAPAPAAATPAPVAAAPAAPAVMTALTTDAFKTAVTDFKAAAKNPYDGKAYATWGEYVTSYGTTFVPVGLYVPKSAGISGDATFFGVIEDASGNSVYAFEQPATLVASKDDFFVDKSLTSVPAVKGRGIFGLAQNGKVVALASTDMEVAASLDKDATAISPIILSNNVFPLSEAQKAEDPFSFGGVRVVPKANHTFTNADELWYFFELRNPGLPDTPAPDGSSLPKVQVKIDVAGTTAEGKPVKMAAPPTEVNAIEMKGVPGHYAVGNAIPLASFKPGDYTFTVKVIDTLKKTSYTLSDKFKVQ